MSSVLGKLDSTRLSLAEYAWVFLRLKEIGTVMAPHLIEMRDKPNGWQAPREQFVIGMKEEKVWFAMFGRSSLSEVHQARLQLLSGMLAIEGAPVNQLSETWLRSFSEFNDRGFDAVTDFMDGTQTLTVDPPHDVITAFKFFREYLQLTILGKPSDFVEWFQDDSPVHAPGFALRAAHAGELFQRLLVSHFYIARLFS